MQLKKAIAELIGTFILVFIGTGTAVFGGGIDGIGIAGIALAFGLTIVAAAYTIGTVSGAHLNPAVSFGMWINKRISTMDFVYYVVAQILGALLASFAVRSLVVSAGMATDSLGQNGFDAASAVNLSLSGALVTEIILTFIFVLVIMTVTSNTKGNASFAGLFIGLTLTMVHLIGIPLTGTSVNPARSLAPAIFVGGEALSQVWVFIVAPLVGAALAAIVAKTFLETEA